MKALIAIVFGLAVLESTSSAMSQTANFSCPKIPTVVEFSDYSKLTATGNNGADYCQFTFVDRAPQRTVRVYAPTVALREHNSQTFATKVKAATWWPLQVGKKLEVRFDGSSPDGVDGSWYETVTVDKYEIVTTLAGKFEVFLVTRREESARGYKATYRDWWSPILSVTIKAEFTDNQGRSILREAIKITH